MSERASDHLAVIRDRVKGCVHGGLHLDGRKPLRSPAPDNVLELVRETEEDNRILNAAILARAAGKPCLRLIRSNDGGDAA